MNIIQQIRRIEEVYSIKRIEKVLFLGSSLFFFLLVFSLRTFFSVDFSYMQDRVVALWLLMACATAVIVDYQFTLFQNKQLNWFKMMGLSNFTIFLLAIYDCRIVWAFVIVIFSVINFFLTGYPVILLVLSECIWYCYLLGMLYYGKVCMINKFPCARMLIYVKRTLLHLLVIYLLSITFMGDNVCKGFKLQYERKEAPFIHKLMLHGIQSTLWRGLFIGLLVASWLFYCYYIYGHELYEDSSRISKLHLGTNQFQDFILRFNGNRWKQIVKLNYISFHKNKNNSVGKVILMVIWMLFVVFCNNQRMCFIVGLLITVMTATLIMYRIRDDMSNHLLYQSLGLTLKTMFRVYCSSGVIYLFDIYILIAFVGVIRGSLSIFHLLGLVLWLLYQTTYFVSFNLYYVFIRKMNVESPFYEIFEFFVGSFIGETPLSLLYPVIFQIRIHREDNQFNEMSGDTYDDY